MFSMTAHATRTIESKGFPLSVVEAVWHNPDTTYPSFKHPGQHKRTGQGICLCCDDRTGKVITVFVNETMTALRSDQTSTDALQWARKNSVRVA